MKRYFLGLAGNYKNDEVAEHLFTIGHKEDLTDLSDFLKRKYGGQRVFLAKNGRSALALMLKAYFDKGDKILVNGFTCYAVYEAIKTAGMEPVFVDINKNTLNFDLETLRKVSLEKVRGIIVQNTLGNPVNMTEIEKFANMHKLTIIEDLAHCAGVKYPDGREAGTVGSVAILSFGKEKSIDTVSGGAAVARDPYKNSIEAPRSAPKISDHLRSRFYPLFGRICRGLTHVHLGGILMRGLIKIHWVEKSADNKLDLNRRLSKFEAKLALRQLKGLARGGEQPLRDFYYVRERGSVLKKLRDSGYYFDGLWYEKPVSPERYYKKVHFPEKDCPNAVYVASHIVNLPKYYSKRALMPAKKIIEENLEEIK